jgi:hypothetical protein
MKAVAESPASPSVRSNAHGLTLAQQSAVDLLAAGKNDTETAEALKLNRVTVTRWRLFSPEFRAALADRRAAVWGAAADRLRALIPQALDALAEALEDDTHRVPVALALLKLAGPLPLVPTESTDPEDHIREVVERERERTYTSNDDALDRLSGRRPYSHHLETVRKRLATLAPPEPPEPEPPSQAT